MKTIKKTIQVIDKFILEGCITGFQIDNSYYGIDEYTITVQEINRGRSFDLPVNKDFITTLNYNKPLKMEIKILDN